MWLNQNTAFCFWCVEYFVRIGVPYMDDCESSINFDVGVGVVRKLLWETVSDRGRVSICSTLNVFILFSHVHDCTMRDFEVSYRERLWVWPWECFHLFCMFMVLGFGQIFWCMMFDSVGSANAKLQIEMRSPVVSTVFRSKMEAHETLCGNQKLKDFKDCQHVFWFSCVPQTLQSSLHDLPVLPEPFRFYK